MRTPEEKLLNPRPGSKIAEARDYGIDLTLLVSNLRLTPEERLRKNDDINNGLDVLADAIRKAKAKKNK
ncbi:MAG: hypothetical protein IPM59_14900 [Chloracidobacterium sp.]|nr:hypothetical protein [Chloracidobacterium sp.]